MQAVMLHPHSNKALFLFFEPLAMASTNDYGIPIIGTCKATKLAFPSGIPYREVS